MLACVEQRLVVERVCVEHWLHDAADDVRPVDAGPEQDGLERGDDRVGGHEANRPLRAVAPEGEA